MRPASRLRPAPVLPADPGVTPEQLRARPRRPHEASRFFFDSAFQRVTVKVLPGEYFVHDGDVAVTTTLGSCVAACLHDAQAGIGGLNHFMLPAAGDTTGGARFGLFAMELLINELLRRGAQRNRLEAKIFGGGHVMHSLEATHIGQQNVAFARAFLQEEGIPLRGEDVLDLHPRRVCMFPRSGLVLCRRLPAAHGPELAAQELNYRAEVRRGVGGGVELF